MQCSCTHMQFLFMDNKIDVKCMPILVEKALPILIEEGKFWKNNNNNFKQHQHKFEKRLINARVKTLLCKFMPWRSPNKQKLWNFENFLSPYGQSNKVQQLI